MSARNTIISRKSIATLSLLILAIIPIGWVGMWTARNAPAESVDSTFQEVDFVLSTGSFGTWDKGKLHIYGTNIKTGKLVSRSLQFEKYLGHGSNGSRVWVTSLSENGKSVVVQRCNLANDQTISTNVVPFDVVDYRQLSNRLVAMDNCILCVRNDRLESYDALSGQMLDSIAITGSTDTFPTTNSVPPNRVLLMDVSKSKTCTLVEAADDGRLKILRSICTRFRKKASRISQVCCPTD